MKHSLLIIFGLLFSYISTSQTAIVSDIDGWSNVRKAPNSQSEILHKIANNFVFWYEPSSFESNSNWIKVYIPKNNYSLEVKLNDYIEGYIHKSRVKLIENLKEYKKNDFEFKYIISPFDKRSKIIELKQDEYLHINGRPIWGTDGEIPQTQVDDIKVTISGRIINISPIFYSDIFECSNQFKIYVNDDCIFVNQWNSDGAGGYQITWVFNHNGLIQRNVGSII